MSFDKLLQRRVNGRVMKYEPSTVQDNRDTRMMILNSNFITIAYVYTYCLFTLLFAAAFELF